MEKIIKADIDCLLATTKRTIEEGDTARAMAAATQLVERIADLLKVDALREVSNDYKS